MSTFILSFLVVSMVFLALALGVIFGRKPISGSCGGSKGLNSDCSCKEPCTKRVELMKIQESSTRELC